MGIGQIGFAPLTLNPPAARPKTSFGAMLSSALSHVNEAYAKRDERVSNLVTGQTEAPHSGAIRDERSGVLLHLTVQSASRLTSCITTILQIPI